MEVVTSLVNAAVDSGEIRPDFSPGDLLRVLAGFAFGHIGSDWKPSAYRLVDLLMDGLRTVETSGKFHDNRC